MSETKTEKPLLTLDEIRARREVLTANIEFAQMKRQEKLFESIAAYNYDGGWGSYAPGPSRETSDGAITYTLSTMQDRFLGANWPFWRTEWDLQRIRALSRILCGSNQYAIGLLNGLTSYVIGTGYTYRVIRKDKSAKTKRTEDGDLILDSVDKMVNQGQRYLDRFHEVNEWNGDEAPSLEEELFWRDHEDGEVFLRHEWDEEEQVTRVWTIEPEQITQPPGSDIAEWSFGVKTPVDNYQRPLAFCVLRREDAGKHDIIDAEDILHSKINVKRTIKRGLTDFYMSTRDSLDIADRLRRAIGEGSTIQACIAEIVQYDTALNQTVTNLVDNQQPPQGTPQVPGINNRRATMIEPGTRRHIPRGMQYVPPPGASNVPGYVEALQSQLRAAGVRWNAPEWLSSSDTPSTGMASQMGGVAESPFLISIKRMQQRYTRLFRRSCLTAFRDGIAAHRLPEEFFDYCELEVKAGTVETRDTLKDSQTDQILIQTGIKDRETASMERGLDPETVQTNNQEYTERFQPPALNMDLPPDDGDGGGAGGGNPFSRNGAAT
jgi:capsid protein